MARGGEIYHTVENTEWSPIELEVAVITLLKLRHTKL